MTNSDVKPTTQADRGTYACECGAPCDTGNGPLAHWKLDDGSGSIAVDSVGGHDGAVTGADWVTGTDGGALDFFSSDDTVDLTSDSELDDVFVGGATVTAWIYPYGWGESDAGRILDKTSRTSGNRDGWALGMQGDDDALAFVQGFSGDEGYWITPDDSIRLTEWQHIAVAYDADDTANDPSIYIDGVLQSLNEDESPDGSLRSDASRTLTLGNYANSTNRTFDGLIDDVRIYGRLLSDSEIMDLVTPPLPLPIAHWKLDDATGSVAVDSVGGHDGTVVDAIWDAGQLDGGLRFDGSGDVVEVPHDDTLSLTTGFTITAWVRNDSPSVSGSYRILSKEPDGANSGYWLSFQSQTFWVGVGGAFYSASIPMSSSVWYHLAVSFDDARDELIIYVNGSETDNYFASATIGANTAPLRLGANWESGKHWDGILDDVRIYDQILTSPQVASLAVAGGGGGGGGGGPTVECGTFRDEYNARSYSNQDGTLLWSTDWSEINESNGPTSGDIQVRNFDSNYQQRIRDADNGGEGVQRAADLSSGTSATLSVEYRRNGFDDNNDYVTVDVSSNGGSSWTEVGRVSGAGSDSNYVSASYDISSFISADTRIRFLGAPTLGNFDELYLDNVEISLGGCSAP